MNVWQQMFVRIYKHLFSPKGTVQQQCCLYSWLLATNSELKQTKGIRLFNKNKAL